MKHTELRAIVHNIADSLASGLCFVVGHYEADVFGEASRSPNGSLTIDFLSATVVEGTASPHLCKGVVLLRGALLRLCHEAGGSATELREARVRFWSDRLNRRFEVTIEDDRGRRSITEYAGIPGKRIKVMDALGRLRPKRSIETTRPAA